IAPARRRRGYATESLRAVANWIEAGRSAVVEARVRLGDVPSESLVRATAFRPTEVFLQDRWRIWLRPPAPCGPRLPQAQAPGGGGRRVGAPPPRPRARFPPLRCCGRRSPPRP